MRFALIPVSLLALSACSLQIPDFRMGGAAPEPAVAPVVPEIPVVPMSAKERVLAAAEANGCALNTDNITTLMTAAQVTSDDLRNILPALVTEGRAAPAGDAAFTITTPACATT